MLVPISWLEEYTKVPENIEEFAEKMIMSGSNIEGWEVFGENIKGVKVGKVVEITPHPNADKLVVCKVDVGENKPVNVITGAPNVFTGAFIPCALPGARIPGPLHGKPKKEEGEVVEAGEVRGVLSEGILCSAHELGFPDKVIPLVHREGLFVLNGAFESLTPGEDLVKALKLKDKVVEFEITPNRPDCLSIRGMALEAKATFKGQLLKQPVELSDTFLDSKDFIEVEIKRPELSKRYVARVVTDVAVKESPWWLQLRLMLSGMRPINNIVDITNYVMLELGEPIHAFDIRQIKSKKIVVDVAKKNESFTTLDGTVRTMPHNTLMIKDGDKSVAVAGIMGGLDSEIVKDTKDILIEAANFNQDSIRLSSKALGLRTEASSRFEKGVSVTLCQEAVERVCYFIEQLKAGKVTKTSVDCYPEKSDLPETKVRVDRVNHIMGVTLSKDEMIDILKRLDIEVREEGDVLYLTPPHTRLDLLTEIDYVEEVSRIYGYDKLPLTVPRGSNSATKSEERKLMDKSKEILSGLGLYEIQTYSFVSPKAGKMAKGKEVPVVTLINPLGDENSSMRTALLPNVLEILQKNMDKNNDEARVYEIGNIFIDEKNDEGLPLEKVSLSVGMYNEEETFFTLKGVVETLLKTLGVKDVTFEKESKNPGYHPGRCANVYIGKERIGTIGEIHPEVLANYHIDKRVMAGEIDFDYVMSKADTMRYFTEIAKYPSVVRDIALVVKDEVEAASILSIIYKEGTELLESAELFDVYRGNQIEEGMKSCAFTLTYRSKDRTLREEEVALVHDKVLKALKERVGASLRDS
ncbi:MAG: phenylalanine--tRNA ligase subunit beta [Anaerovoracaceae bacterium]